MGGVEDPEVVDAVTCEGDRMVLVMVEHRPWGVDADQGSQLKAKINAYAGWIADGSFAEAHPEAAGAEVVIRLECDSPPTGPFAVITVLAARRLEPLGIGFEVRHGN